LGVVGVSGPVGSRVRWGLGSGGVVGVVGVGVVGVVGVGVGVVGVGVGVDLRK
jgi:hypothetical protein